MSLFNIDLSSIGSAVSGIGKAVSDTVASVQGKLTPEQNAEFEKYMTGVNEAIANAQSSVNETEAKSSNMFIAGWRPLVGWICGFSFGLNFLLFPIVQAFIKSLGSDIELPKLDTGALMSVMIPMLGLIGGRSWEKVNGAQDKH